MATLVIVGLAALGVLIWRLSSGPIEFSEIARLGETAFVAALGNNATATIGTAELEWSWQTDGLIVRLQRIEARGPLGVFSMSVPSADIELRTLPLLWGAVKPSELHLNSPTLHGDLTKLDPALMAAITTQGGSAGPQKSVSPPGATASPDLRPKVIRAVEGAIRGVADLLDQTHEQGFMRVTIDHGSIDLARRAPEGNMVAIAIPDIEVDGVLDKVGNMDLGFSAKGEIGRWSMRLRKSTGSNGHSRRLLFEATDVTARDLVGQLPPDVVLNIPFYPTIEATLDDAGTLANLNLDLRLGAGQFHFGKYPEDEMLIDEGQISAHWDKSSGAFIVDQAGASTGNTTLSVKGRIVPPPSVPPGQTSANWTYDLGLDKGVLQPRDAGGDALPVDYLHLGGSIDVANLQLLFDDIDAKFGGSELKGSGRIDFNRPKPQIMVNFALASADWSVVRRAWPAFIASGARNWFLKQVIGGTVSDAAIKLDLPMFTEPKFLPSTAITFSGKIHGGAFHTFGNLPDAIGLEGRFSSLNRQFEAVADKGQAATRYPRHPDVTAMRLVIPDSYQRSPKGHIEFQLVGENGAVGEIANAEPLVILDDAGIKLDQIQGSADVTGSVDMILEDNPKPEQIDFRVEATLDRFGSPYPIQGRKFQDGNIKILADVKGTSAIGKARIDGVVTDVNFYEPRNKTKTNERRDFKLTLDEATRQRMGLDLSTFLSGPIQVAITQSPGGNEKARHIDADLTTARLTVSVFGWSKGAGVPAKMAFDMLDDDKGTHLEAISIESEGVQVKGRADLDRDHRPVLIDLSKFSLRRGDDAKLRIQRGADQTLQATFEAVAFDIRGLIQTMKHSSEGSDGEKSKFPDMDIKAKLSKVVGYNDVLVSDMVLETGMHQGAVSKLALTGQMQGGHKLKVDIQSTGKVRLLKLTCDEAGGFMGFFDVYDAMRGGAIELKARLAAPGEAEGDIRMFGFRLVPQNKSPREATVQPDGTKVLPIRQASATEQTNFDKFAANYALRKGVITMTQGIARGPVEGVTISGQMDLNNQKMQIKGTYIPAYGLNNLMGRIPLLGEIVGAGSNEGLLGVTFKVVGSIDDPVLQVNPISAIAPGIFRRIFEYQIDEPHTPDEPEKPTTSN